MPLVSRIVIWSACFLLGAAGAVAVVHLGERPPAASSLPTTQPDPTTTTRQRLYRQVMARDNPGEIFAHARAFRRLPPWEQDRFRALSTLTSAFVAAQPESARRSLLDLPEIARAVRVMSLMESQQPQQVAALAARRRSGPP